MLRDGVNKFGDVYINNRQGLLWAIRQVQNDETGNVL